MKKSVLLILLLFFVASSFVSAQKKNVTFNADMRIQEMLGKFAPATDKVTVPGAMNNWLNEPPANTEKVMTDADNDKIYTKTYSLDPGTYDYKFNIGLGWDGKDEPGDNSKVTVGTADVTVTRFFKGKAYTKVAASVTFNIDMTLPIKTGFDPATGKVYVAGNFTNWGTSAVELKDPDGDKKYSATVAKNDAGVDLKSGDILIYKFIYSKDTPGNGTWESISEGDDYFGGDKNRVYGIVDGTNTVDRFWQNKNPNVEIKDGIVSFAVNMSVLEQLNVYNPAVDVLQIRGGFNGWSDTDKDRSVMLQDFLSPTNWFLPVTFSKTEVKSVLEYKYFVVLKTPGIWTDSWERPLSMGGGNRTVEFAGTNNQEVPKVYYDDVNPAFYVAKGQTLSIKFRADMKDAFDPTKMAIPMKAGDKLYWLAEQPLFARMQGWTDNDEMTYFELTDADGDKIFEGTLTIKGPHFNAFEYRYAIQRAADKSWKQEEAGFGKNAYRVRFIAQTKIGVFTQPYTAPLDKWTDKADKSDQVEKWPTGLSDIKTLENGLPTEYTLEQNYPNPFNPSTSIRFSIPKEQMVTLKVFNVLGQEVATLVNQVMKGGNYSFDFNASKLSSGVYMYKLEAGDFSAAKKMLLVK